MNNYRLVATCGACPEQYDVYDGENNLVAYLRLRHGYFYVSCPDVEGTVVYSAHPEGDGMFKEHERDYYLDRAMEAIVEYYDGLSKPEQ
jgi:hypothetical protein